MSVRIMSMVFHSYPAGGGEMLLALALADHADDRGENIFPSVGYLATKTRQSERTVQRQLADMVDSEWLQVVTPGGHGKRSSTRYRVNPAWIQKTAMAAAVEDAQPKGDKLSPLEPAQGDTGSPLGCHPRRLRVTQLCHPNHQEPSRTTSSSEPPPTLKSPEAVSDPAAGAGGPPGGEGDEEKILLAMIAELDAGRPVINPAALAARIRGDKRHVPESTGQALLALAVARIRERQEAKRRSAVDADRRHQERMRRESEQAELRLDEMARAQRERQR